MKTIKNILIASFIAVLFLRFCYIDVPINGWSKTGSMPSSYKTGLDLNIFKTGHKSAFIESQEYNIDGFVTIAQACNARSFQGTRIKITSYIKSENLTDWAGMWLRIDSKSGEEVLGFDNMQDRPVVGTSDWTKYQIIMNVPIGSGSLKYGVLMSGTGKIWFDNVSLEILDNLTSNSLTDTTASEYPERPVNLDFEE